MDGLRIPSSAAWVYERGLSDSFSFNSSTVFQATTNSTAQFIKELQFAAAKSIRTSTIILASFNAVAAFATACGILYEAHSARKRNQRRYGSSYRPQGPFIQPPEMYPLILSCGITVQGIGFSVAQAQGLKSLLSIGCTLVSQFMLPAVFIVPYIQLVFGGELAIRALRKKAFPRRGRYTITICLLILGMLLLTNFLIADFVRSPDFCFASLFWFVAIYSRGCFATLLAINIVLVACTVVIFVRLSQKSDIDISERVNASRMVYYLALGVLSNTLIIPFFFSLGFHKFHNGETNWNQPLTLSMVASVVADVSGLMTGGLHLFLRSSTISTIGPRDKVSEYDRHHMKNTIRRYNDSDSGISGHMMGPVSGATDLHRMLSDASLISGAVYENKDDEAPSLYSRGGSPAYGIESQQRLNPLRSNAFYPTSAVPGEASIRTPEPVQMSGAATLVSSGHSIASFRKIPSSPEPPKSLILLPATTYTPGSVKTIMAGSNGRFDMSSLKPPPSINNLAIGRHRRDSSLGSSATVQIGLRLSNVENFNPVESQMLDKKVYTLEMAANDDAAGVAEKTSAAAAAAAQQRQAEAATFEQVSVLQMPPQPSPSRRPSPLSSTRRVSMDEQEFDSSPHRDPVKDCRMKTLPPVPHPQDNLVEMDEFMQAGIRPQDGMYANRLQSTSSTYSPVQSPAEATMVTITTKLPSPRGVGFASVSPNNSPAALPFKVRRIEASSGSHNGAPGKTTPDWI